MNIFASQVYLSYGNLSMCPKVLQFILTLQLQTVYRVLVLYSFNNYNLLYHTAAQKSAKKGTHFISFFKQYLVPYLTQIVTRCTISELPTLRIGPMAIPIAALGTKISRPPKVFTV